MKVGGLFFGYGGLDLAVQAVFPAAELAWYSEYDRGASKVGAYRFPGIPNHGDVTQVDWSQVEPVDILTGGSPCQDLSSAGRRKGMTDGTRSNLWVAMREAIAQLRPGLVVWENVRGAFSASANSGVEPCPGCVGDGSGTVLRALGRVLGDLSDLGYNAAWCGLRAADVGAAHGRFRVFVLAWDATAHPRGLGRDQTVEHDGGRSEEGHGRSVLDERYRDALWTGPDRGLTLLPTPEASRAGGTAAQHRERKRRGGVSTDPTCTNLDLLAAEVTAAQRWGDYAAAIQRWEHVIGRPAPEPTQCNWDAFNTRKAKRLKSRLPVGMRGSITFMHKGPSPQLSARFTEWLMGVPDGWITDVPGVTRNEALKMCGNGVVPQQGAAALRWLLAQLEQHGV